MGKGFSEVETQLMFSSKGSVVNNNASTTTSTHFQSDFLISSYQKGYLSVLGCPIFGGQTRICTIVSSKIQPHDKATFGDETINWMKKNYNVQVLVFISANMVVNTNNLSSI